METVDVEVIDDGRGHAEPSPAAAAAGADIMAQLRETAVRRLKRWALRTALWGGVLGLFATEHTWARVALWIWAPFAIISLVFNLLLFRLAKRGAALQGSFTIGGMGPR
jgi:hypothetical protein